MKKSFAISLFSIFAAIIFSGCGYKMGTLVHPQLETVAVAPVVNETLSYNASAMLRQKLTEAFMTDGSLKLKSVSEADCIVYARILKVNYYEIGGHIGNTDDDFLPDEWKVTADVEFSVIIPGRAKPLIGPKTVSSSAEFVGEADLENARTNGLRQALYNASRMIVTNLTEAW